MKLLRNPIAVGVLVVLALAIVVYQFWPMLGRRFARSSAPPPPASPAPAAPAATPTKPEKPFGATPPLPQSPTNVIAINVAMLESNSVRWVDAPRNDPFRVRFYVTGASTNSRPAMDFLTLNAVWQQGDDSPLAVINNHVFSEGDVIVLKDRDAILQYKLSAIELDSVWVDGPNGREPVRFKLPTPSVPKPAGDTAEFTLEKEVRVTPKSGP